MRSTLAAVAVRLDSAQGGSVAGTASRWSRMVQTRRDGSRRTATQAQQDGATSGCRTHCLQGDQVGRVLRRARAAVSQRVNVPRLIRQRSDSYRSQRVRGH